MSTVIIGGGGLAHNAVTKLEQASLSMTDAQRKNAEMILAAFVNAVDEFCQYPRPAK